MDKDGSVPRTALPAPLALAALAGGLVAMQAVTLVALPYGLRTALVASEVTLALPAALAAAAYRLRWRTAVGFTSLDRGTAVLVALGGVALWAASLGLFELQYAAWRPPPGYLEAFQRLHEALRPKDPVDAFVSLLAIAIVPALAEELLVRGLALPSLVPRLGTAAAVVVSAVLFAVLHLDPYRAAFTFALGIALGILRIVTGSLTACVFAHALLNTITFLAAPFTDDPSQGLPAPRPWLGAALFVVGGTAGAWVLRRLSLTTRARLPRLGA